MLPESTDFFDAHITLAQHGKHGWADWGAFLEAVHESLELFHDPPYCPAGYRSVGATRMCQTAEQDAQRLKCGRETSWCQWAAETLRAGTACKASCTRCAPQLWQKIPAAANLGSQLQKIHVWNSPGCFSTSVLFFLSLYDFFFIFLMDVFGLNCTFGRCMEGFFLLLKLCLLLLIFVHLF